ncbi:Zinc finger PHD-finger [Penicillium sp. DV-2018c]|nr:Zinc finger PHD-finger [Penicillium sp. DV-2018c]
MGSRKRTRSEATPMTEQQAPEQPGLLSQLRNNWEFASLMQYIAIFGQIMKIDEDFGIEELEVECLKPEPSYKLLEIGLCLLKWISSHRGLTFDNFDEYTRRQFNAKAPHKTNPFGHEEEPKKFIHFDVFTKLRVLHQLTTWTFWNPDRIRDKMPEKKETEQIEWRIEEFGWDRQGRTYYVLDDNRLYRRTDPPLPPPTKRPKKKAKSRSSRASRTSKRVSTAAADDASGEENNEFDDAKAVAAYAEDPFKWECVAVTLQEYQAFLDTIQKTKDADEKQLRDNITEHVLPILEKAEEAQQRKRQKREKELLSLQLVAGAKRSSRLAAKEERERQEREAAEAARKHEHDLAEARREQAKQQQLERDRQSRMMTREQRIKDREQKRLLHEAELARIAEEQERIERGESRVSARNLKADLEKYQKNLADLSQEDQWIFDCSGCGVYGENLDDGSHSVACEKCNVWQHSKCLGISQEAAEKEDFHFVCRDCKQKEEEANMPKLPPLKFRVSTSASPSDAPQAGKKRKLEDDEGQAPPSPVKRSHIALSNVQNEPSHSRPILQSPAVGHGNFYPPPSPQRRTHHIDNTPLPSSSPPRPPFSPPKGSNGLLHSSVEQYPRPSSQQALPPMQQAPHLPPIGSFHSVRPMSSHSAQSPIQNQPSMSPTQGNHDVGPLAGFPPVAPSHAPSPWSSFETPRPQSGHGGTPSMSSNYPSFSAATPNGHHSSPPQSSHGMGMSGISPTKHSPRPPTASGMAGAPVLPPIRRLEPSPKLMGRSSPDAPIPPPVKCMTPEQEERRQRENASMLYQPYHYQGNGQHPMSSPSLNRIPPLGSGAGSQYPDPVPSPHRGSNGQSNGQNNGQYQ